MPPIKVANHVSVVGTCDGCAFDVHEDGHILTKACTATRNTHQPNSWNCNNGEIAIRDTKQGLADYIAQKLEGK